MHSEVADDRPRLLFVVNAPEFFVSHRLALALAARRAGYEVHVATANGAAVSKIVRNGFVHHCIPLSRSGSNPMKEAAALWSIYNLFCRIRPRLVHLVTVKPNIYGGIAARLARTPGVIAAVSGLGHVFKGDDSKTNSVRWIARVLYRVAYGHKNLVAIFQNSDDRDALIHITGLPFAQTRMIRGSGVDLAEYTSVPEAKGVVRVLFASRLLKTKGVLDFIGAARLLRARGVEALFLIAGDLDLGNPASLSRAELDAARNEGIVEVLGHRSDMSALISAVHIVALPSYYGEGLPKVLIEAAACGRAVVTTDHPGCRDAIIPGQTGLLVPPRDVEALAEAIRELVQNSKYRSSLGKAGRAFACDVFSVDSVIRAHLEIYRDVEAAIPSDRL